MTLNLTWFVHFVSYYLAWIACVYFAAHDDAWTGPALTLLILGIQITWQVKTKQGYFNAICYALAITLCGTFVDTLLLYAGLIYFNANPFGAYLSAPWMMCLWLSFGFYTVVTMDRWLDHYFIWAILAFFFLPAAYWVGLMAHAAIIPNPTVCFVLLGLIWCLLLPGSFYVYNRMKFTD